MITQVDAKILFPRPVPPDYMKLADTTYVTPFTADEKTS